MDHTLRNGATNWALVAHAYNPSYLGSHVGDDCGSRPALTVKLHENPSQQKKMRPHGACLSSQLQWEA
jgi:hypothetical protein